ncbi:phospholipase D-like domain-containing protein [Simiduia curdlanivorans]|uniref:Phospholipase D-like domain-containing protein n=1 Tax=Simiduia curdlanivorans TaxID=1492769 RepID=A0ABV8V2J9_9GAMM|nr:phospholipase D-like domain-containing protein [Simiduia curdlanivorans]MDN3641056.1 phospholipase D-like domain-containing protein [Simiduia curdlanivorans]
MTLTVSLGVPFLLLHIFLAGFSFSHLLLRKEDLRSAFAWLIVIAGLPFLGSLVYWIFGINRISRRAHKLMANRYALFARESDDQLDLVDASWQPQALAMQKLSGRLLCTSRQIEHFHTGDQAYPAMLNAIAKAKSSIYACFYNFDGDGESWRFIEAIGAAQQRGLDVRVVLDGLGVFASQADAVAGFRSAGVACELFNPPKLLPPRIHINLRNHRKLLVIDQAQAFTGGMNIVNGNVSTDARAASIDEFFAVEGRIVRQLLASFLADWSFSGGELEDNIALPEFSDEAGVLCRAIEDGPDKSEHLGLMALVGACTLAKEKIRLVSPYFIPPEPLVTAIQLAALRGVEVQILIPQAPDHRLMGWACEHALGRLLRPGIQVFQMPPPFMHSKLYVFDSYYCLFGSSNLDARSLKLNFEMLVEIYDQKFTKSMAEHIDKLVDQAIPLTLSQLRERSLWLRLRAAMTTLFAPYL